MRIETHKDGIEIEFTDLADGKRKRFTLSRCENGGCLTITACVMNREEKMQEHSSAILSVSVVKAIAAAVLLMEV